MASPFYCLLRFYDIRVIAILCVYLYIVNDKLRILSKDGVVLGITDPASADRQIENDIKRLIIRRGIRRFL